LHPRSFRVCFPWVPYPLIRIPQNPLARLFLGRVRPSRRLITPISGSHPQAFYVGVRKGCFVVKSWLAAKGEALGDLSAHVTHKGTGVFDMAPGQSSQGARRMLAVLVVGEPIQKEPSVRVPVPQVMVIAVVLDPAAFRKKRRYKGQKSRAAFSRAS
jgi:hypothetical protein